MTTYEDGNVTVVYDEVADAAEKCSPYCSVSSSPYNDQLGAFLVCGFHYNVAGSSSDTLDLAANLKGR